MSSISAILRKKANKQGLFPIAIRITKNRKSTFLYIGQYLDEKFWDTSNKRVKKSHPNSVRLNNLIAKKLSETNDKLIEFEAQGEIQSVSKIKKSIRNKIHSDFFEVAQIYIETFKARKKIDRYKTELRRIEIFREFLGKTRLGFNELDVSTLKRFQTFLLSSEKRSPRTVANYLIFMRTIYNFAISEEVADPKFYPFGKGKIQIKIPDTEKIGLNKEELQLLEQVQNLTETQEKALDLWLFSFYFAGIRVGDVLKMKWSDFRDGRLYYRMNKNKKLVSLKIPEKAQIILNKYKNKQLSKTDVIFPYLTKDNLNNELITATRTKTMSSNMHT